MRDTNRVDRQTGPAPWVNAGLLLLMAVAMAAFPVILLPRMTTRGASASEAVMALPGEEVGVRASIRSTRAVTIDAPPARIWPWLVQIGQDRGPISRSMAAAGFVLAALLTSWALWRRSDGLWALAALGLSVPFIAAVGDPRAALVGYVATALILLGLRHVRRWWAVDGAIATLVLLVLLFARDAYLTIGWTLLALALVAIGRGVLCGLSASRHRTRRIDSSFDRAAR